MARQEQNTREVISADADVYGAVDSALRADELRRKRKEFDDKVMRLANKVVDYQQKGPEFQYLTDMMLTFLDVTVQLQGTMEVLSAVNDAMECLTDAIKFIDSSLSYDQDLITDSLQTKYGVFARIKQRRQIKRAIKNNTNRMLAMVESINGKFGMAMALTDALKNSCVKMKIMMDKSRRKSEKRRAKMAGGASVPLAGSSSATDAILAQVREKRGLSSAPAPAAPSDAPAGTSSSPVTDIDDIL